MNFEKLKSHFKSCFAETHTNFNWGDGWIYAEVEEAANPAVHYELICRGGDWFVELHLETNVPEIQDLRKKLKEEFRKPENERYFIHFTYYSNNYWQSRMPVTNVSHIAKDIKRISEIVKKVFGRSRNEVGTLRDVDEDRNEFSLEEIAVQLRKNNLIIPGVQRGRVWNAERMATLWDSILQGFPIGSFSVRRLPNGKRELLDGQQRANAIALAYRDFPPKADEMDRIEASAIDPKNDELPERIALETPILWIDLDGAEAINGTEKKYAFFVTTASQPWGYDFSNDETKNVLLKSADRRNATVGVDVTRSESGKPYPCELYPVKATLPVPFSLFRKFVAQLQTSESPRISTFINWIKRTSGCPTTGPNWRWLDRIQKNGPTALDKVICADLVQRVKGPFQSVFWCDATNVEDRDIALYFTRIGKGGVRPSDAELAFSVLKSKLDNGVGGTGFRKVIEAIARKGMASASQIAEIAVRCFVSDKDSIWGGGILEKAIEISANEEKRIEFMDFMLGEHSFKGKGFADLVKCVRTEVLGVEDDGAQSGFSEWHASRYCTNTVGVFLFALLEVRDFGSADDVRTVLRATIELICNYGYLVDRCCRYIREVKFDPQRGYKNRVQHGLSRAFRDSYRGNQMLKVPLEPDVFCDAAKADSESLITMAEVDDNSPNPIFRDFNYGNQRAYSVLLFACRGALPKYVPCSAQWAEENCPWDYDHMLPHIWAERMKDFKDTKLCRKLIDSIGNLSPLLYSLNRKISDNDRSQYYPYLNEDETSSETQKRLNLQSLLLIEPSKIKDYQEFGFVRAEDDKIRSTFCKATLTRLEKLYSKWYSGTGISQLLNFEELDSSEKIDVRRRIMTNVREEMKRRMGLNYDVWYLGDNSIEHQIRARAIDFYRYSWLTLGRVVGDVMIAFTMNAAGDTVEIGLRKSPERDSTSKDGFNVVASCSKDLLCGCEIQPKGEKYWYLWREIDLSCEEIVNVLQHLETLATSLFQIREVELG